MGPKKRKLTRGQASETLFGGGGPADLSDTSIPTYRDIAKYCYYLENAQESKDIKILTQSISEKLVLIWGKVSDRLPLLQEGSINKKIQRYLEFLKDYRQKHASKQRIEYYEAFLDKIFDICKCTCKLEQVECDHKFFKCKIPNCKERHIFCACDEILCFFYIVEYIRSIFLIVYSN